MLPRGRCDVALPVCCVYRRLAECTLHCECRIPLCALHGHMCDEQVADLAKQIRSECVAKGTHQTQPKISRGTADVVHFNRTIRSHDACCLVGRCDVALPVLLCVLPSC